MSRRLFAGLISPGVFDFRISRPGYDAKTDDVNDINKISFAASRQSMAELSEVGVITATETWTNFTKTYTAPPTVLLVVKRSGEFVFQITDRVVYVTGGLTYTRDGTFYVPVVETGRIMVTKPANYNVGGITAGDSFIFLVVSPF